MVAHDLPIRGRKQQPLKEYGRAYARDPIAWLVQKRKRLARNARRGNGRRQAARDLDARRAHGWVE